MRALKVGITYPGKKIFLPLHVSEEFHHVFRKLKKMSTKREKIHTNREKKDHKIPPSKKEVFLQSALILVHKNQEKQNNKPNKSIQNKSEINKLSKNKQNLKIITNI